MQQNLVQLREVVEKMQATVPERTPLIGDQVFSDLQTDSDHILAELMKLERETNDLVHEVILPSIAIFLFFPTAGLHRY